MGLSACGVLSVVFAALIGKHDGGPCTRLHGPCGSDLAGRALAPAIFLKCNILPGFDATAQVDAAACAEQLAGDSEMWAPLRPTLAAFAQHGCETGRQQLISGVKTMAPDSSLLDQLLRYELSGMNPLAEMQARLQAIVEESAPVAAWRTAVHAPSFLLQRGGGEGDGMRFCVRPAATPADSLRRLRDVARLVKATPHPATEKHGKLPLSLMERAHALPAGPVQWELHCSDPLEMDPEADPFSSAAVGAHALVHAFESGLVSAGFAQRAGSEEGEGAEAEVFALQRDVVNSAFALGRGLLGDAHGALPRRQQLAQRVADAFLTAHPLSGRAAALRAMAVEASAHRSDAGALETAFDSLGVHAALDATSAYARSLAMMPDTADVRAALPLLAADPADAGPLRTLAANASDSALRAAVADIATLTSLHSAVTLPSRRDANARVVGPAWRHAIRVLNTTVKAREGGDPALCLLSASQTLGWSPHPPAAARAAGALAADMVWLTLAAATAARGSTAGQGEGAGTVPPLAAPLSAVRRCIHPEGGVDEPAAVVRACRAALLNPFVRDSVPLLGARAEPSVLSPVAACAWAQWVAAADAFAEGGTVGELARAATGLAREVRTCALATLKLPEAVHPAPATDAVAVVSRVRSRAYHRCASNGLTCPLGLLHPDAAVEEDPRPEGDAVADPAVDELQRGYSQLWAFVRDHTAASPADDDDVVEVLMRPREV